MRKFEHYYSLVRIAEQETVILLYVGVVILVAQLENSACAQIKTSVLY